MALRVGDKWHERKCVPLTQQPLLHPVGPLPAVVPIPLSNCR